MGPVSFVAVAARLNWIWSKWATQILVLLSFALQIFLFLFARALRRGCSAGLRILLWLAYLGADSTAVYTLGHLSVSGSPHRQNLGVFWAPFLLVHLGSQDTITAYSLEDNQLWPRHLLNLGVQAFGVAYIVYKHISEILTLLRLATVLMSIVGVVKYGERILALKCATTKSIESSIYKPVYLPKYCDLLPPHRVGAHERDEEELLLFAQGMLPVCKGGFTNLPLDLMGHRDHQRCELHWNWDWKTTFKVVERELSLMYDILYTKAAVIHTWYGYCIRVFSPLVTVVAFVLFQLSGNKKGYMGADVAVTYILLVGAFLLDMMSLFSALGSTWTCNILLKSLKWSRFGLAIMSLRRLVKAAAWNRGWSGSIGQFNLFLYCTHRIRSPSNRVASIIGWGAWWKNRHYSETLVMSEDVKELVFKHVWHLVKQIYLPEDRVQAFVEEPMAMMPPNEIQPFFCPESYKDTARRRKVLDYALKFSAELQEAILEWHICTNIFVLSSDAPKDAASSTCLKAITVLSDYMVFLVSVRPDMIPGLELRSRLKSTINSLTFVNMHSDSSSPREGPKMLAMLMQDCTDDISSGRKSPNLEYGIFYAKLMLELADTENPDKPSIICKYKASNHVIMGKLNHFMPDLEPSCSIGGVLDMPKVLTLMLDTWVHLLVWSSVRCSREAHAREISHGSELTTIVWLMEEHASRFFYQPTSLDKYSELL